MTIPIKKITMRKLQMKLVHPFTTSFGTVEDKEFFILEAHDYNDNCGYGESVAFTTPWYTEETTATNEHIITDFLIEILRKNKLSHPDDVSKLFSSTNGTEKFRYIQTMYLNFSVPFVEIIWQNLLLKVQFGTYMQNKKIFLFQKLLVVQKQ